MLIKRFASEEDKIPWWGQLGQSAWSAGSGPFVSMPWIPLELTTLLDGAGCLCLQLASHHFLASSQPPTVLSFLWGYPDRWWLPLGLRDIQALAWLALTLHKVSGFWPSKEWELKFIWSFNSFLNAGWFFLI